MKPIILISPRKWHNAPKILFLSALFVLISACVSQSSNFENRPFDADSAYCVQLRQKSTNPFHDMDNYDHDTDTQKVIVEDMDSPISKMDKAAMQYNKDCESLSAYNARKKTDEFTFGKSKNNNNEIELSND